MPAIGCPCAAVAAALVVAAHGEICGDGEVGVEVFGALAHPAETLAV